MNWITKYLILFSLLCALPTIGYCQDFPANPNGYINDYANILNIRTINTLNDQLQIFRDSTSTIIVVTTVPDLQGYEIEQFAETMFNAWKMWQGELYNGVLILVSRDDRAVRIEVGYGLEAVLPDIQAGRIINEQIIPAFRNGNYDEGITRAVNSIMKLTAGEYDGLTVNQSSDGIPIEVLILLFIVLTIVITVLLSLREAKGYSLSSSGVIITGPRYRRSYTHTSRSSGGRSFGGFSGGGSFGSGGGGASGRW